MSEYDAFSLLLFSTDPGFIQRAEAAGVDGFIVDWEYKGKAQRQNGADTEINQHGLIELRRVRASANGLVLCRINGPSAASVDEIELAIGAGADEILLPMVTSPVEVERVLDHAAGRCGVGILIETVAAVQRAAEFADLPLTRVYVGLNDLAIARGSRTIFDAIVDGTVERLRQRFAMPFGFAGLTLPDAGSPVPCRLLIAEMMRLDCQFSFLRRSFHRDIHGRDPMIEVPRLRAALNHARIRDCANVALDHLELEAAISNWADSMAPSLATMLDV
jgi:hypothetical protein